MPPNAPIQLEQFGTRFQCSRKAKKILNGFDFNSTSNNDTINQCCVEVCLRIMIPFILWWVLLVLVAGNGTNSSNHIRNDGIV